MLFVSFSLFAAFASAQHSNPAQGISVNYDGSFWALAHYQAWYCGNNYPNCEWGYFGTHLSTITSNRDHVCGVATDNKIWCKKKIKGAFVTDNWIELKGSKSNFSDVSVNSDGSLWGLNKNNKNIYFCSSWESCVNSFKWTAESLPFLPTPQKYVKKISSKNNIVCVLFNDGNIHCKVKSQTVGKPWDQNWKQLSGNYHDISVNRDFSLWAIKGKNIYHCSKLDNCTPATPADSSKWEEVTANFGGDRGDLAKISSNNDHVCTLNKIGKVWCDKHDH